MSEDKPETFSVHVTQQDFGVIRIVLSKSVILLAAGETWGDSIDQCDDILLFDGCGAAKVAGFY